MSAAEMQIYDALLAKGFQDDQARKVAAALASEFGRILNAAKEHADQAVAAAKEQTEQAAAHAKEHAAATFVSKDQAAEFATRGDVSSLRDEFNEFRKEVNGRLDSLTRFVAWGIVANITVVCIVGGIILRAVGGV